MSRTTVLLINLTSWIIGVVAWATGNLLISRFVKIPGVGYVLYILVMVLVCHAFIEVQRKIHRVEL